MDRDQEDDTVAKITGWLFKDSKGVQVELTEFGPKRYKYFPNGGWILIAVGIEKPFVVLGPGPIESAWHAARRDLVGQGYQLYRDFTPTRHWTP